MDDLLRRIQQIRQQPVRGEYQPADRNCADGANTARQVVHAVATNGCIRRGLLRLNRRQAVIARKLFDHHALGPAWRPHDVNGTYLYSTVRVVRRPYFRHSLLTAAGPAGDMDIHQTDGRPVFRLLLWLQPVSVAQ